VGDAMTSPFDDPTRIIRVYAEPPAPIWYAFTARCVKEHRTKKSVLLELIRAYVGEEEAP
jgi:hypothetical protein